MAKRRPRVVVDRWRRWGLVGNPFRRLDGHQRLGSLVFDADPRWQGVDDILACEARVVQFIGDVGAGKTTHLRSLVTRLKDRGPGAVAFQYVPPGVNRLSPMPAADVWVVDEAQRLRKPALRKLLTDVAKTGRRLIVSSHEDLSSAFASAGLSFETIQLEPADADRIAAFFDRRLQLARSPEKESVEIAISKPAVAALNDHAAGDLNRAEELLYELFQQWILPREPQATVIDAEQIETIRAALPADGTNQSAT